MPCFSCDECYNCKYFQNNTWDWWMLNHPEDGCPKKYPFGSIFNLLQTQKAKRDKRSDYFYGYY